MDEPDTNSSEAVLCSWYVKYIKRCFRVS